LSSDPLQIYKLKLGIFIKDCKYPVYKKALALKGGLPLLILQKIVSISLLAAAPNKRANIRGRRRLHIIARIL